jgi:hypothetical protein
MSGVQGHRGGDLEPEAAAAANDTTGGGEQAQPQPFGFPSAGRAVQGEHRGPGEQVAGQGNDLAPDLVLGEAFQRQEAGVRALPGILPMASSMAAVMTRPAE